MHRSIGAGLVLIATSITALAQTSDDWKLCRRSDEETGIPACQRLIKNSALSRKERAEAHVELGQFYAGERAIVEYDKAIELEPRYARAYRLRAKAHIGIDDYDKAIADATKAIDLEPGDAEAYQVRGYAHQMKKDLDGALADFDKSIDLKPMVWAHIQRAEVFVDKGAVDRAISDYRKAADLVGVGNSKNEADLIEIVEKLIKIGRVEEAAYPISRVADNETMMKLRLLREYERLWSNSSATVAMAESPRVARAVEVAEKAVVRAPRSLYRKWKLADVLIEAGRSSDAERVGYETLSTLSTYDDNVDQEFFLRGILAKSLVLQAKFDRAQTIMEPVLEANRAGRIERDPVGPLLNYSEYLLDAGRYREAFEIASQAAGNVSGYGASVMRRVQACSAFELGRKTEAESIVGAMVKDMDEETPSLKLATLALVCVGDTDRAAAIVSKSVKRYPGRISWFVSCETTPAVLQFEREERRRIEALLERSDVQDAIKSVARTRPGC